MNQWSRLRLFIAVFFSCYLFAETQMLASTSRLDIDTRIAGSAAYLESQILDNGKFNYWVNVNKDVRMTQRYNALRHAGTLYSLCQFYKHKGIAPKEKSLLSARFFKDEFIASVLSDEGVLAVWSSPETTMNVPEPQAKLGGAGLGLVALLSLEDIQPDSTLAEVFVGLGRFIFFMQKEDGSFYSKFIPSRGGLNADWTSLYYPGEAALGLIMLYEYTNDPTWLRCAVDALSYLAAGRSGLRDDQMPADHWALLATAQLLELQNVNIDNEKTELIKKHAVQICRSILSQQLLDSHVSEFIGCFSYDGRVTPTATRLEGLLATLKWLPASHPDYQSIVASVDMGMDFLFRAQICEGEFSGGFPRAIKLAPEWAEGVEGFNRRATEIRIDYVQHALSAMLMYRDFLDNKEDQRMQMN